MSTANVEAMIDDLVDRFGLADALARARCLKWLQSSEEEAWSKGPWWFKEGRVDLATTGGTRVYALSVFTTRVHGVEDGDGVPLVKLHPVDFRAFIKSDATSGTPQVWCPMENNSSGYAQIEVWPVPSTADTLKVIYERPATTLADLDSSKSGFPAEWRHVVLLRAEAHASLHQGQSGQAQGFLTTYAEQMQALAEFNGRQRRKGEY